MAFGGCVRKVCLPLPYNSQAIAQALSVLGPSLSDKTPRKWPLFLMMIADNDGLITGVHDSSKDRRLDTLLLLANGTPRSTRET